MPGRPTAKVAKPRKSRRVPRASKRAAVKSPAAKRALPAAKAARRPLEAVAVEPAKLGIAVQNPQAYRDVRKRALETWLRALVRSIAPQGGSLAARLTSDAEVRRLNRRFRGLDKPTDVLSFPGEDTAEGYHVGDIVISVPTARRQAGEAGHRLELELRTLLLHGLLHCLGYDHEADDGEMARRESRLRRKWIQNA